MNLIAINLFVKIKSKKKKFKQNSNLRVFIIKQYYILLIVSY